MAVFVFAVSSSLLPLLFVSSFTMDAVGVFGIVAVSSMSSVVVEVAVAVVAVVFVIGTNNAMVSPIRTGVPFRIFQQYNLYPSGTVIIIILLLLLLLLLLVLLFDDTMEDGIIFVWWLSLTDYFVGFVSFSLVGFMEYFCFVLYIMNLSTLMCILVVLLHYIIQTKQETA